LLRALPQLIERLLFGARCTVEIAVAQRLLGITHGLFGPIELPGRLHAVAPHAFAQLTEAIAQAALPFAELATSLPLALLLALSRLLTLAALPWTLALLTLLTGTLALLALARLLAALLTLPTLAGLLPWLLALLALLTRLTGLATLLLSVGIVEELLLLADDVPELVHHLHHLIALLALTLLALRHAAVLQLLEQISQLAQHFLGTLARTLPRHVLDIAHHALEILLANGLPVVTKLRRLLAFRLPRHLLEKLVQRLPKLIHELADFLVRRAILQRLREPLLRFAQGPLGIRQITVFKPHGHMPKLVDRRFQTSARAILLQPVIG
jgi:hypothetical protein